MLLESGFRAQDRTTHAVWAQALDHLVSTPAPDVPEETS